MSGAGDDDDGKQKVDDAVEALRRATLSNEGLHRELAALQARFNVLIDALTAKEILAPGHIKLMDSEARDAARLGKKDKVQLRVIEGPPKPPAAVDCENRLHLCHARCCTLHVTLSEDDLAAGLAWEIEEPYLLRRSADGYCTYLDRGNAGCTIYDRRPYDCRTYTCKDDPRIWLDFDNRVPAELPSGLEPLKLGRRSGG